MTNEISQEQIERQIAHLDRYRDNSLVQDSISEKHITKNGFGDVVRMNLENACLNFYGVTRDGLREGEPAKIGKYPKDLTEIVDCFDEKQPLNPNLLKYEDVRAAYKQDKFARNKWLALTTGSYLSTFALEVAGPVLAFSEKAQSLINSFGYNFEFSLKNVAISIIPALAAFVATSVNLFNIDKINKNMPANLREFYKLENKTGVADSFMSTYRNYLLRKEVFGGEK
ncbi:hypothetical protein HY449_03695 [Candidatus Pacearchaeota archaeon]|nr:hypothetical protein [Candidatus Pacearchaeota archaeon]